MKYVQIVTTIIRNRHRRIHPEPEPEPDADLDPLHINPSNICCNCPRQKGVGVASRGEGVVENCWKQLSN